MLDYKFIITEENEGERADKVLSFLLSDKSRSYIQTHIKNGNILINGNEFKPSRIVEAEDEITCSLPDPVEISIEPEDIPINIVYEDKDIIIINKDKNMVVHPAPGHYSGTLVNAIMYHCKDLSGINGILRPGIVHRIDKDTTGLLVICKNDFAHSFIAEQLKNHSGERTYHAICKGILSDDEFDVIKPIGRHPSDRLKMAVNDKNGKTAETHVKVLKRLKNATYIECRLKTGRTHQIRVHLSSLGHPLLGDNLYGDSNDKYRKFGQVLHAKTLGFVHPSKKEFVSFDSELPEYFQNILKEIDR